MPILTKEVLEKAIRAQGSDYGVQHAAKVADYAAKSPKNDEYLVGQARFFRETAKMQERLQKKLKGNYNVLYANDDNYRPISLVIINPSDGGPRLHLDALELADEKKKYYYDGDEELPKKESLQYLKKEQESRLRVEDLIKRVGESPAYAFLNLARTGRLDKALHIEGASPTANPADLKTALKAEHITPEAVGALKPSLPPKPAVTKTPLRNGQTSSR